MLILGLHNAKLQSNKNRIEMVATCSKERARRIPDATLNQPLNSQLSIYQKRENLDWAWLKTNKQLDLFPRGFAPDLIQQLAFEFQKEYVNCSFQA